MVTVKQIIRLVGVSRLKKTIDEYSEIEDMPLSLLTKVFAKGKLLKIIHLRKQERLERALDNIGSSYYELGMCYLNDYIILEGYEKKLMG